MYFVFFFFSPRYLCRSLRDIKCENLLMDTAYNIKLSDFGFARNKMLKKNGQMKTSTTFCGSYAYASPEILKGIPYQPNTSDIWSIGVVLYAMIFGTLPFDDTTYQKLLKVGVYLYGSIVMVS